MEMMKNILRERGVKIENESKRKLEKEKAVKLSERGK